MNGRKLKGAKRHTHISCTTVLVVGKDLFKMEISGLIPVNLLRYVWENRKLLCETYRKSVFLGDNLSVMVLWIGVTESFCDEPLISEVWIGTLERKEITGGCMKVFSAPCPFPWARDYWGNPFSAFAALSQINLGFFSFGLLPDWHFVRKN